MRKILFTSFFLLLGVGLFAQDLNEAQKKLRLGIMLFLKEEGYIPELDSDGDISFKKEGVKYYVQISDADTAPMYVVLYHNYRYDNVYTKSKILSILNEINLYKAVKMICFDSAYSFRAEMFLVNAEQFKYTFYKLMSLLASMEKELEKLCSTSTAHLSGSSPSSIELSSVRSYFPICNIMLGQTISDNFRRWNYVVETNDLDNNHYLQNLWLFRQIES